MFSVGIYTGWISANSLILNKSIEFSVGIRIIYYLCIEKFLNQSHYEVQNRKRDENSPANLWKV